MLEYIILGFLLSKDLTGYDLKQRMAKSTSFFFDASFGSIYPALKRLEAKKYIISKEGLVGGKVKNYYHILEEGRKQFTIWLQKPVEFSKTKNDYLVKIFFYRNIPKELAIANLAHLIEAVKHCLNELKDQKLELDSIQDSIFYEFATLKYGVSDYELLINWMSQLINQLKEDIDESNYS